MFRSNSEKRFGKKGAVDRQDRLCDDGCTHVINVEVSTPYFSETVKALCLKDLLYELIIEIFSERDHPTILMRLGA